MTPRIQPESYAGCDAAARFLIKARQAGMAGERLPADLRPGNLGQGFAVQLRTAELLEKEHRDPALAWKSALPSADRASTAPIYASTILQADAGPVTMPVVDGKVRIEPEIAFEIKRDLPARPQPYTEAEVDAAIGRARLALEILGCRYARPDDASASELLADHMFNHGLVLGPDIASPDAAPVEMDIVIRADGDAPQSYAGVHPNKSPRAGLYWLVEFLRGAGLGLKAGQHVITGSYAGYIDVPAGQDLKIGFGSLGTLAVRFVG
ncbi:MAG: fumarylacetoacetate hydrolase family protein [Bordetella sp.]|uniref:fumarylacetoacetate hydrolase family protein n=1 Tax=Bordetella sp. TaxID=28081 RepID=UPI003F7C9965